MLPPLLILSAAAPAGAQVQDIRMLTEGAFPTVEFDVDQAIQGTGWVQPTPWIDTGDLVIWSPNDLAVMPPLHQLVTPSTAVTAVEQLLKVPEGNQAIFRSYLWSLDSQVYENATSIDEVMRLVQDKTPFFNFPKDGWPLLHIIIENSFSGLPSTAVTDGLIPASFADNFDCLSMPCLGDTPEATSQRVRSAFQSTAALVLINPDTEAVSGDDQARVFTGLLTFSEVFKGTLPLCPESRDIVGALAELHDALTLADCSGAITHLGDGKPVFLTARHCLKGLNQTSSEVFLVFDFQTDAPGMDQAGHSFTSRRSIALTDLPNRILAHPAQDIGIIDLAGLEAKLPGAAELDATYVPAMGDQVFSLGYPLGIPTQLVSGSDTYIALTSDRNFYATLDNFSKSSGSPVFSAAGRIVGVLSEVQTPWDRETVTVDGVECDQIKVIEDLPDGEVRDFGTLVVHVGHIGDTDLARLD